MPDSDATAQIETDLSRNRASLHYLDGRADHFGAQAQHMRQIANELTIELQPLRTAFDQIRHLHTVQTWDGRAATASRQRLDILESRHTSAVRQLDQLIDDLEFQAAISQQTEADLLVQMGSVRWAIDQLEQQLQSP